MLRFFWRCGLLCDLLECECDLWILLWRFVGWMWMWSTMISGVVSWRTSMCGWSAMRLVWCGCNLYVLGISVMSYSWGGCNYPYVMTWSGLCMNCNDSSCGVCENEVVIWNDFTCFCLHSGALNLIWHGGFYEVWVGDVFLGLPKEVSCVGNPWQCDHTHHTQSI